MAVILDGKAASKAIRLRLKKEIRGLTGQIARPPHVVFVQVGDNPASTTYVLAKSRTAQKIGCLSTIEHFPVEITEHGLLHRLAELNAEHNVHGILVQLPLPSHINEQAVAQAIAPVKDIDCFHAENFGRMALGLPGPKSATPQGVMMLLAHYGIATEGQRAVVLGRSNLVGKPMGLLLLAANATVSWCHSRTPDLASICREADILVSAAGRPGLVTAEMVKAGAAVIDVGTNFIFEDASVNGRDDPQRARPTEAEQAPTARLVGDVDFAAVSRVAGYISPVPGGVGPMTIASVLCNAVELWRLQEGA